MFKYTISIVHFLLLSNQLLSQTICTPGSEVCDDGNILRAPVQLKLGHTIDFMHTHALNLLNSNFSLTVTVEPRSGKFPRSHVPLFFGMNPQKQGDVGISIGHKSSNKNLEVRLGDGAQVKSTIFHHQPVKLSEVTTRRIDVQFFGKNGRRIQVYLNGFLCGTQNVPNLIGNIYDGTGGTFGNVWNWKFEGRLEHIGVLPLKVNATASVRHLDITTYALSNERNIRNRSIIKEKLQPRIDVINKNDQSVQANISKARHQYLFKDELNRTTTWSNENLPEVPSGCFRIHLNGLQRTGTNLLAHMLDSRKLFREGLWYKPLTSQSNIRRTPPWKHFHIHEQEYKVTLNENRDFQVSRIEDFDTLLGVENLTYIIAVKNPIAWFVSVCRFWSNRLDRARFHRHDQCEAYLKKSRSSMYNSKSPYIGSKFRSKVPNPFVKEYIDLYNKYYQRWLQLRSLAPNRIYIIKYEDLLNDCVAELNNIRHITNISETIIKDSYCKTRTVSRSYGHIKHSTKSKSQHLWNSKKEYYVEKKYLQVIRHIDLDAIASLIDMTLMEDLQYSIDTTFTS